MKQIHGRLYVRYCMLWLRAERACDRAGLAWPFERFWAWRMRRFAREFDGLARAFDAAGKSLLEASAVMDASRSPLAGKP